MYRHPILALALGATLILSTAAGMASNDIVPVPGKQYRVDLPLLENLRGLRGKRVTLHLDNGEQINGRIKEVHRNLLHLENLRQREFMDALIRMDRISAVETQFRAYQRDLERMKK